MKNKTFPKCETPKCTRAKVRDRIGTTWVMARGGLGPGLEVGRSARARPVRVKSR